MTDRVECILFDRLFIYMLLCLELVLRWSVSHTFLQPYSSRWSENVPKSKFYGLKNLPRSKF